MAPTIRITLLNLVLAGLACATASARERWTSQQAWQWHSSQPWLVGCNFIPSTAINQLEMWQAESFDPETIDRELGWAAQLGFNSVRVFLHNLLWQQDQEGFLRRKLMLKESDVVSFHCYEGPERMRQRVQQLTRYQRPLLCTEYMSRGSGSTFDPILDQLQREKIAAYNWGLVDGKTQTAYPWETWQKQYTAKPEQWFHDIFHGDGRPYSQAEADYIRRLTRP